jgi:hypothetical protein
MRLFLGIHAPPDLAIRLNVPAVTAGGKSLAISLQRRPVCFCKFNHLAIFGGFIFRLMDIACSVLSQRVTGQIGVF